MKLKDALWPVVGIGAVVLSCWILFMEIRGLSLDDIVESFKAISVLHWFFAVVSAGVAYFFLAYYDRLALRHLGRKVPFGFVALTSFTTYALSHNIGATVLSGAVVRYRAYKTKGLRTSEIAFLIAFCSFTYALGILLLTAVALVLHPEIPNRFFSVGHVLPRFVGIALFGVIALYILGSLRQFEPLVVGKYRIDYPKWPVVARQLVSAPLEIIAAAAIIYFALPAANNPGFVTVLAVFLVSFSVALISHAPGGLGVLELTFIAGLSDMAESDVLAALFVFRILYLLIPFALSIVFVLAFEHSNFRWRRNAERTG